MTDKIISRALTNDAGMAFFCDFMSPTGAIEKFANKLKSHEKSMDVPPELTPQRPEHFQLPEDISTIPPREWLYGRHLIRGFVSLLVSPGGVGKSSLSLVEAFSMATGKTLLGDKPIKQLNVWVWNGEDPSNELTRRAASICSHYKITNENIGRRLMLTSGDNLKLCAVKTDGIQTVINEKLFNSIKKKIQNESIDVLIVDPLVASHEVDENINGAMNMVIDFWRGIAKATGCAVELVHHVNKAAAIDGKANGIYGSRGASSLIDGVRSARFLTRMTAQEAVDLGVEGPNHYFQVGMGKANLAPLSKCKWRKMIGVDLHNGSGLYPYGDTVGVCIEFKPPDAFEGVTIETLKAVQQAITDSDEPFAKDARNSGWLGYKVAEVLGWDVAEGTTNKKERNPKQNNYRARITKMISAWIKSGALSIEEIHDSRRGEDVKSLVVGELASTVKNNRGG